MNAIVRGPIDGEILAPGDTISVVATPHPLKRDYRTFELPAGSSIAEIIAHVSEACGVSRLVRGAEVTIDGHVIPKAHWKKVRVKAGRHVLVRAIAGKGMGNIFRSILTIALTVLATFIVGPAGLGIAAAVGGGAIGALAAAGVAGAIMLGGGLLINVLFPPTQTKSATANQSYSIAAQQNTAAKWGPIPSQLGKVRANPKYASSANTEFVGDDQYLRMLFVWGYGPLTIEDIRIGDTSIANFSDVEIQTYQGFANDPQQTLYPSEVIQTDLQIELSSAAPSIQTSAEDANEIVLDLVAPQGLAKAKSGKLSALSVDFKIEMSPAGQNAYVDKGTITLSGSKSNDVIRQSFRYTLGGGQWDVRITRLTADADDTSTYDTVDWTALKTFRTGQPIDFGKPLAITALRIKATSQLNGTISNLNGLVTSLGQKWDSASGQWVAAQAIRNPAELMRLVLQGPANARPVADSQLDLATIEAFADVCYDKGYTFDMYRDFTASVRDTLKDVLAAGRAVPTFRDGKWSVAWEESDAALVQHFTPRNSSNFSWQQQYKVFPHGLRCKFVNATRDYIEDEMLVFDAGYDKTNATLFETAEFPGVTDPALIYKAGKYRIADARERPATYSLDVDFEFLVAQRTDRVAVAHDVIEQGLASGRIKAIAGQLLTLDEPAPMEDGQLYGIRIRRDDGSSIVLQVTTAAGVQNVVTVAGDTSSLAEGNLYTFGIRGQETGIYRISFIKPDNDLTATLTLVDDGPNVQSGDGDVDIPDPLRPTPNPLANYTPSGLRAASRIVPQQLGQVYETTLYWNAVGGPDYSSFAVVGTCDDGRVVRNIEGPDARTSIFDDLASGQWSFTVQAFFTDGTYTPQSAALIVAIAMPDGQVGVANDNILDGAVDELKLADQAVATAKLQVSAVTADILADQAVLGSKLADAAVSSSKLEDNAVIASKIAAASIDTTKFAAGITPVEIGNSLPTTGNFEGRQFYNTSDGKTYSYKSGAWTTFTVAPGSITATQIADGAISTPKLAVGAVTADAIAANAITTGKIAAGAIGAAQIAAKAVTVDKLTVTNFTNLVPNPQFDGGSLADWAFTPGQLHSQSGWVACPSEYFGVSTPDGTTPMIITSHGSGINDPAVGAVVNAGDQYLISTDISRDDPCDGNICLFVFFGLKDGTQSNSTTTDYFADIAPNIWQTISYPIVIPAGATRMKWALMRQNATTGNVYFTNGRMQRKGDGAIFVDGSITANLLAANSVTADQISAGAITASKLSILPSPNIVSFDPTFSDIAAWTRGGATVISVTNADAVGGRYLNAYTSTQVNYIDNKWPVSEDQDYLIEVKAYQQSGTGGLYGIWNFYDYSGNLIDSSSNVGSGWLSYYSTNFYFPAFAQPIGQYVDYTLTVGPNGAAKLPTGAKFASLGFIANYNSSSPGQVVFSRLQMSALVPGSLVVDGTIYSSKIVTGTITADKLAANSVTAGAIAANAVTAVAIQAGSITGDKLVAKSLAALGITVGSADIQDASISSPKRFPLAYEELPEAA